MIAGQDFPVLPPELAAVCPKDVILLVFMEQL